MRSLFATIRRLTIPAGATGARTVIGPDIPTDLVNFYTVAAVRTVVAATLSYDDFGNYFYDVALAYTGGGTVEHAYGFGRASGQIYETEAHRLDPGPETRDVFLGGRTSASGISSASIAEDVDFKIYRPGGGPTAGISQGRGRRDYIQDTGSTGATAAEVVCLTGASIIWPDNRAFEILIKGEPK